MLNFQESLIVSPRLSLYDQFIPKDHLFRQMNDVIDFSFVQKELASKADVINPSTLTKFRKLRLKDGQLLDLLISETVETPERSPNTLKTHCDCPSSHTWSLAQTVTGRSIRRSSSTSSPVTA